MPTRSIFWLGLICCLAWSTAPLSAAASSPAVTTRTMFTGADGAVPTNGDLLYDRQTIFGATYAGGAFDQGVIFQVAAAGTTEATVVYAFSGPDGAHPNGGLVIDAAGNLYGTTAAGGAHDLGILFKLVRPASQGGIWLFSVLHDFAGPDGAHPSAGPTFGPDGTLYGVTYDGGNVPCVALFIHAEGCGTVFAMSAAGSFRIIHSFGGFPNEGAGPQTNLVIDPQGVVIGTTNKVTQSGDGGTLFAISPEGHFTNVSEFFPKALQGFPIGHIVRDAAGNVYGMSQSAGGRGSAVQGNGIWKVTALTHRQSLLKILPGVISKSGIVSDNAGNFYGSATGSINEVGVVGAGNVFVLTSAGSLQTYAALGIENLAPMGGVIIDPTGVIWGTSSAGGQICPSSASLAAVGCGTVFSIAP